MFITNQDILDGFTSKNRVWQGIPGIERTRGGRLFATFYSGATSETCGNYCVLLKSEDDGNTWSEPIAAAYAGEMSRCFDPVLWIDPLGRLWFTWAKGHKHGLYGVICDNPDADVLRFCDEFYIGEDIMMNKPTVLSTGEWLFPVAIWDLWYFYDTLNQIHPYNELYLDDYLKTRKSLSGANVYKTTDNGKTFTLIGGCRDIQNRSHDEHMIYEKNNGVLVMLTRTQYGISKSLSYDRGNTWTNARNSGISGPSSRFHVRRLRSGRLLLVNHDNFKGRNNLTAFLSEDEGETWPYKLLLDGRDEVSYPDMTEAEDGYLYIIYDRDRGGYKKSLEEAEACAREVLLAKINENDILEGKIVSENSFLERIVSKLGKYEGTRDLYGTIEEIDPNEFVETLASYDDADKIFKTIFVYYPIHCQNMHRIDAKKLDVLLEEIRLLVGDTKKLKQALTNLVSFLNRAQRQADQTRAEPLVNSVIDRLQSSISSEVNIGELADSLHVSVYYLCHLFKVTTGYSIYEYRNICRFAEAKRLISESRMNISEICAVCGFSDSSYFTKKFKETEGMTPTEYRRLHRY